MASASGSSGAAWVSSLGNTFGGSAPGTSSTSSFGNPFASANMTAAAVVAPSQIGSKEDKNSMMAAFSDMGLALEAVAPPTATSSAKALLEKKENERQQEQQVEQEQRARRHARQAAKENKPASAFMQALDAFAGEVSQSDTFAAALSARKTTATPGAFTAGSRRARQKTEKAVARGGKSVRDVKRAQRRDRHVY